MNSLSHRTDCTHASAAVATTSQGCRCAARYSFIPSNSTVPYWSSGACLPGSLAPQGLQQAPWCVLEGACNSSSTVQVNGKQAATCASGNTAGT